MFVVLGKERTGKEEVGKKISFVAYTHESL